MKKIHLAFTIVVAGMFSCIPGKSSAQADYKNKEHKKETRYELQKQYAKFIDAYMQKDSSIPCTLVHPDAQVIMPNGTVWNAEQTCQNMMEGFRQVQQTYKVSFDLDTIQRHGDTAEVLVHQYWHRLQMKGGKLRDVETTADQWETWVKKDGFYLRSKVDRIVPGVWKVDGKRIDPSKPYDPDAPEYEGK